MSKLNRKCFEFLRSWYKNYTVVLLFVLVLCGFPSKDRNCPSVWNQRQYASRRYSCTEKAPDSNNGITVGSQENPTLWLIQELPIFFILLLQETHTDWLRVTTEFKYNASLLIWRAATFPPTGYFVSHTKWCLAEKIRKSGVKLWITFLLFQKHLACTSRPRHV